MEESLDEFDLNYVEVEDGLWLKVYSQDQTIVAVFTTDGEGVDDYTLEEYMEKIEETLYGD